VLAAAAGLKESRSVRTGLERLCDALGSLGFQVSLDSFDSAQTILVTPTCPLRPLVVAQPTTGEIDRGMWAGLVECCVRGVNATGVECDTARCRSKNESCAVRISLQR
jgi:hypothetical protein